MTTNQQADEKEAKECFSKIWELKEPNRKAEWTHNKKKELRGFEKGSEVNIHLELMRAILKKVPNWKMSDHDGIYGIWFGEFTSIHCRLGLQLKRCLEGANIPGWMTKGKTTLIQKDRRKGKHFQQL